MEAQVVKVPIIQVKNLTKVFKTAVRKTGRFSALHSLINPEYIEKTAVDSISFNIRKGEIVGYIGPNGAGKSTSIKMLTGILKPSSGKVEIAGLIPYKNRRKHVQHIGVVLGQKTQLWWDIPLIESLMLLKEIYKVDDKTYKENMMVFEELLSISDFQDKPVRQLSLGQRMRGDLAASLLHSPDILFLDEPTIGVDVVTKEKFRVFIRKLNQEQKTTILLTTHDMADIERICERIIIIDEGKILHDMPLVEMKKIIKGYDVLEFEINNEKFNATALNSVFGNKLQLNNLGHRRFKIDFDSAELATSDLISYLAQNYQLKNIAIKEPEIETLVRDIFEKSENN